MASSSEFTNIPGMTKEMREGVAATFDALSSWRDEIEAVNERCSRKVVDQMSTVARAMGWPDQAVQSTAEYLKNASTAQTELIDQIMEGWKRQLRSPMAPMALPQSFTNPPLSGAAFANAMPEFNPLTPWTFWLQAAEMWQRTWMPDVPGRRYRSH